MIEIYGSMTNNLSVSTTAEAAKIGRDRTLPRRDDWDDIRDEKMYDVVLAKFTQNPDLQKILLGNLHISSSPIASRYIYTSIYIPPFSGCTHL